MTLNKRLTINGTTHEVDVYVVTRPKTPYETVVLFECKDWREPVGKNEVIVLKEKVELLGAARGILVAREISKDAKALIQQYSRLQFQRCIEDIAPLLNVEIMHTVHDSVASTARLTVRDVSKPLPKDFLHDVCQWGNRTALFRTVAQERLKSIAHTFQPPSYCRDSSENVHWFAARERIEFEPGEFTVCGTDISVMEIDACFVVKVSIRSPCYRCAIDGQGQVHTFELHDEDFPRGLTLNVVFAGPKGEKLTA